MEIEPVPEETWGPKEKVGPGPFVLGGLSFIPILGAPLGAIALVWGLISRKRGAKWAAALGAAGILFSVVLFGSGYYFVRRGGPMKEVWNQMAVSQLDALVPEIELYKLQTGAYPESLEALRRSLPRQDLPPIRDPSSFAFGKTPRLFFYKRVGADHYYLRGVGPDGVPFTADDILPRITPKPNSKIGLLVKRQTFS